MRKGFNLIHRFRPGSPCSSFLHCESRSVMAPFAQERTVALKPRPFSYAQRLSHRAQAGPLVGPPSPPPTSRRALHRVRKQPRRRSRCHSDASVNDSARVHLGPTAPIYPVSRLHVLSRILVLVFHTQYLRVAAFSACNSSQGYRRVSRPPSFSYNCRTVEVSAAVARRPCSCVFVSAWCRQKRIHPR